MDQIEFLQTCYVDARPFFVGQVVEAKSLPKEWLDGALLQRYVKRLPQAESGAKKNPSP